MGGGAWPFLVGGAICLVDSDNERDSALLNSPRMVSRVGLSRRLRFVRRTRVAGGYGEKSCTEAFIRRRFGGGAGRHPLLLPLIGRPGVFEFPFALRRSRREGVLGNSS